MSRTLWIAGGALAIAASISGWMLYLRAEPPRPDRFSGPSRSDYELVDFALDAFDEQGKITFRARSPRLVHDERRKALAVATPSFVLYGKQGQVWHADAEKAWIDTVAKRIDLETDVIVQREGQQPDQALSLRTEKLVAHTEARRIESDRAVEVTRPGSILRGRGLEADLSAQSFELKADVNATFAPNK